MGGGWSALRRKSRGRHDQNTLNLYLKISKMELKKEKKYKRKGEGLQAAFNKERVW